MKTNIIIGLVVIVVVGGLFLFTRSGPGEIDLEEVKSRVGEPIGINKLRVAYEADFDIRCTEEIEEGVFAITYFKDRDIRVDITTNGFTQSQIITQKMMYLWSDTSTQVVSTDEVEGINITREKGFNNPTPRLACEKTELPDGLFEPPELEGGTTNLQDQLEADEEVDPASAE